MSAGLFRSLKRKRAVVIYAEKNANCMVILLLGMDCYYLTMQRLLPLLILLIFLSVLPIGCARFEDRPLNPVNTALRIDARSLSNPALLAFINSVISHKSSVPLKNWDIDHLTLAAMYYHPDLALARAQVETADAATITAAQRPNPNFTLSPTWISNLASSVAPWIAASSVSIPIETAGKRDFRVARAEHLTEAARLRVVDAAWLIRARLRLALLEVYAAQEAERLLQKQLALQQQLSERLEQQRAVGEIARLDVMRAQLAFNQLQLNARTARKRMAESRVLLSTAIGLPVQALAGIALDFTPLTQPPDLKRIPVIQLRAAALH